MLFVAYSATEESSIIVRGTSLDQFSKLMDTLPAINTTYQLEGIFLWFQKIQSKTNL